jgi:uracil-DNA glycosylase
MNAEQLLRLYLEQRREMGERDLVLDELKVEEVMRLIGARGIGAGSDSTPRRADATVAKVLPAPPAPDAPAAKQPPAPAAPAVKEPLASEPGIARNAAAAPGDPPPDAFSADWRSTLRTAGASPRNEFPLPPQRVSTGAMPGDVNPADPPVSVSVPGKIPSGDDAELMARLSTLDELATQVAQCQRCALYATALNPVSGEGNPNADFMCVGEAPGQTEDETGRPFVGAAGQLVTKILAAINFRREDVFIANVLKHRPPGNRNPLPEEVSACRPYLVRQIELVRPRVILALGTFAAQSLLNVKVPLGKLRGTTHSFAGIPVIVTYHPAALLRNPAWKRPAWEDVQLARRIFDSTTP